MQFQLFKNIQNLLYQENEHFILWLCIGFGIGCALTFSIALSLTFYIIILISSIFLIGLYLKFLRDFYLLKWLILFIIMVILGTLYSAIYIKMTEHPILNEKIGPTRIFGTVDKFMKVAPNQYRFILKDVNLPEFSKKKLPYKIRLNYRTKKEVEFSTNDRVLAFTQINPISPPSYPHGFDFQKFLYFKNIGATGYILGFVKKVKSKKIVPLKPFASEKFREKIKTIMAPHLSPASFEIATALFTGERNQINPRILENIRHSGLAHLLAISGLHVGLIAGLILFVMRYSLAAIPNFGLFFPIKKIAALTAIIAAASYVYIVDAPISAQRALVMISLLLFSYIINRNTLTLRFIAIAAFIVLLFSPYAILEAGFQMSFSAVTALVAFYENYRTKMIMRESFFSKSMFYFWGIVVTSMIATFATLPFTIYHFHQFIPLGILSNVIAIPITAFIIMPFGVLGLALSPFHLEMIPLKILNFGIEIIIQLAEKTANLSFSVIPIPQMPAWGFTLCTFSLIWLFLWKSKIRFFLLPLFILTLTFPFSISKPDLLMAPKARLITLINHRDMLISSKRRSHFTRRVWREAFGINKINEHKISFDNHQVNFRNHLITFIPDEYLAIDNKVIYQKNDFANDAIAIYFHRKSSRIIDNATRRGDRPWIPKEEQTHEK